jgi:PadR family transcriptional regulator
MSATFFCIMYCKIPCVIQLIENTRYKTAVQPWDTISGVSYGIGREVQMNIQFKKGVLELCVLSLLADKDCYGYELVNEISKRIDISEGTIYPLLRRLKDEGLLTAYIQESDAGPPRKYYVLTENGRVKEWELRDEWMHFATSVNMLLEMVPHAGD